MGSLLYILYLNRNLIGWLLVLGLTAFEFGWLVVLGLRPFETVFQSISGRLRKERELIDERKNVQTTPCPTLSIVLISRTPRHWKLTQHHRTTPAVFETVFQSISGRLPERGREKREVIDERKNV